MHRITNPNLEILEAAVELLDELIDQLVFLGGCATGLLLTDMAAPPTVPYQRLSYAANCHGKALP